MPDVFGGEGGGPGQARGAEHGNAPRAGEGPAGRYMRFDNEAGVMELCLPPRLAKYRAELQEELLDAFYGAPAGARETHQTINQWIAEWIRKKEEEDPDLVAPDAE